MMRPSKRDADVVIYGATGFTGRRVASAIRARQGRVVLAGRNAAALAPLAAALDATFTVAPLEDGAGLAALARRAAVLVNCAGPFSTTAAPLAEVALRAATHYVDVSAEQGSAKELCEGFDARAREHRVAILPAHAFYAAIADALGSLVAAELGAVERLDIAYRILRWRPPPASFESRIEGLRRPWYVWNEASLEERRWWPSTRWFDFGEGIGCRRLAAYPTADVVLLPRHLDARAVTVGLTVETLAPPLLGPMLPHLANAARILVTSPARAGVERLARSWWTRTSCKREQEEPHETDETAFDVVVRGRGGRRRERFVEARASGRAIYDLTATIVADSAMALARQARRRERLGHGDRAIAYGVRSPAQTFEPRAFLRGLEAHGVQTSLGPM